MNLTPAEIIIILSVLAFSISIHESAHSIVAYFLGDKHSHGQGRFSLNPLKHIDPITTIGLPLMLILIGAPPFAAAKPVPINSGVLKFKELGMALVGLAGPLSNLFIAIITSFILKSYNPIPDTLTATALLYTIYINVGLGVFNLIPFPPLDGSRILYAVAPDALRKIMLQIENFGFSAIIFFMFIIYPFLSNTLVDINRYFINLFL